jgi:hypothetical protein
MRKSIFLFLLSFFLFFHEYCYSDDAIVLKYSVSVKVAENKCIKTKALILQINNSAGDKYSIFNLEYSGSNKLNKINGEIRDINGKILRDLTNKDITTTSLFDNSTFYNDNYVKKFSLKHNVYPYIIELDLQYELSPYLSIANWSPAWDSDLSTLQSDLTVSFPHELRFRINSERVGEPLIDSTNDMVTYHWKSSYTTIKGTETFAPPINDMIPFVSIVPIQFKYVNAGSFESWRTMGDWIISLGKNLEDLTNSEKANIDEITQGISDPYQLIRILYHYMQDNTRYINVNMKQGGMISYPASYVCNNRFGDCKALTNYMKAMLAYKGIPSNKIYVESGENPDKFYSEFPSQQFDHVILAVPLQKDTLWLECTSKTLPVNYIGSFTQNRPALITEQNNSRIIRTPALSTDQLTTIASYHFSLFMNSQKAKMQSRMVLKGDQFEKVIDLVKYFNEKEKRDYLSNSIQFLNYQITNYGILSSDRDSVYRIFQSEGTCTSPIQSIGEFLKVTLPPLGLPVLEKVKDRVSPVRINQPIIAIDTIYYDFDKESVKFHGSDKILLKGNFGMMELNSSINNNILKVVRKYELFGQKIPLDQYKPFYDFINKINSDGTTIFLETPKM